MKWLNYGAWSDSDNMSILCVSNSEPPETPVVVEPE